MSDPRFYKFLLFKSLDLIKISYSTFYHYPETVQHHCQIVPVEIQRSIVNSYVSAVQYNI